MIRPAAQEWDEREETPWPVIEEAAKAGLYSLEFIANSFTDKSGLQLALASEELSWGDAGIALSIMGTALAVSAIFMSGTPEQQGEWLPQCYGTPGDLKLAAFAVSEADAGSDVSSLKTRAVYDEAKDEWVINGNKTWITNGGLANTHVVVAQVDPELGSRGHASFIVPEGTPGISQGRKFKKLGIRASHTAEVVLEDCRVPNSCLLGGKDRLDDRLARAREGGHSASQVAMGTFEASRPYVGAQALGVARAAYEYALDYAKERTQFGRAIIENQGISFALADMQHAHRRQPLAGVAGRVDGPDRPAVRRRPRAPNPSCLPARLRWPSPRRPCRSWAAPATSASIRSSAGTGTPRSSPSSRAPRRSSDWSSPRDLRSAPELRRRPLARGSAARER